MGNDVFRFSRQSVNPYIRESAILDIVREYTRVPVPRLEIIQDGEFNYARHHMLMGHYIDPATYDKWPVTRRKKFASDCAAFLYDIHQIPRNRLTHIGPPTSNSPKPHHRSKDDVYPLLLRHIPMETLDKIYQKYLIACDTFVPDPVFLHKDFEGKNFVVTDNFRLGGVFDFGNSAIGDRTREFAFLYNPIYPKFLNDLLDAYETISGIRIQMDYIRAYMLRSIINSMPELYSPELADIQASVVESRCKKILFFQ